MLVWSAGCNKGVSEYPCEYARALLKQHFEFLCVGGGKDIPISLNNGPGMLYNSD